MQTQRITLPQTQIQTRISHPIARSWMKPIHVDDSCVVNGVVYRHDDWQHWTNGTHVDELLTVGFPHQALKVGQYIKGRKIRSIQLIEDARYKGSFERHLLWYYIFE